MNDSDRSFTRGEEKRLLKAGKEMLRDEYPQSDRTGCPAPGEVRALALRMRKLRDSTQLVEHIATCSPCFVEYSKLRIHHKRRRGALYILTSVAAAVVLMLGVLLFRQATRQEVAGSQPPPLNEPILSQPNASAPNVAAVERTPEVVIDLRMRGVVRGDDRVNARNTPVIELTRTKLSVSVQLPVGSEDGLYEVAVLNANGSVLTVARGQATLKSFIEVLPVELDLSEIPPGSYQLGIRRASGRWQTYPVILTP